MRDADIGLLRPAKVRLRNQYMTHWQHAKTSELLRRVEHNRWESTWHLWVEADLDTRLYLVLTLDEEVKQLLGVDDCLTEVRHQTNQSRVPLVHNLVITTTKISPMRNWRSTPASQVLPSSKSRDTKTRTDIKNPARWNLDSPLVKESVVICQLQLKTQDETDFENGRISNFQCHVTLTLDRAVWHHSWTSTFTPNFNWIGETFCGQTDRHRGRLY